MIVAFDTNILIKFIYPNIENKNVQSQQETQERLSVLVAQYIKNKTEIAITTPVLAEILTNLDAEHAKNFYEIITSMQGIKILNYDKRAALENAMMETKAKISGDKREGIVDATRQAIKFDRQIIAICKVNGIKEIYTTDSPMARYAVLNGLTVKTLDDIKIEEQLKMLV